MSEELASVRLQPRQLLYLRNSSFLEDKHAALIGAFAANDPAVVTIRIHRGDAEDIRAALTEHLARVGFDASYELTNEGEVLEALIDAFIVK